MKMPSYPAGVPNPLTRHYHPYPTRFHGTNYVRPVFLLPYVQNPYHVNMPGEISGLGDYNVGQGIFRPGGYGGGLFDGNLAGLGATAPTVEQLTQTCVSQTCKSIFEPNALAACIQACADQAAKKVSSAAKPASTPYVPPALPTPEATAQASMIGSGDSKWVMFAVGGALAVGTLIYLKKKGKLG